MTITTRVAAGQLNLQGGQGSFHFQNHPILKRMLLSDLASQNPAWINSLAGFLLQRINQAGLVETDLATRARLNLNDPESMRQLETLASKLSLSAAFPDEQELRLSGLSRTSNSLLDINTDIQEYYALPPRELAAVITTFIESGKYPHARKLLFETPSKIQRMRDPISLVRLAYHIKPEIVAKLIVDTGTGESIRIFFRRFAILGKDHIDLRWLGQLLYELRVFSATGSDRMGFAVPAAIIPKTIADKIIEDFVNSSDNRGAILENIITTFLRLERNEDFDILNFLGDCLYNLNLDFIPARQRVICLVYEGEEPSSLLAASLAEEQSPEPLPSPPPNQILSPARQLAAYAAGDHVHDINGLEINRIWTHEHSFLDGEPFFSFHVRHIGFFDRFWLLIEGRKIHCLDCRNGAIDWTHYLTENNYGTTFAYPYLGYLTNKELILIDIRNRSRQFRYQLGSEAEHLFSPPLLYDGRFYWSDDDSVFSIMPETEEVSSLTTLNPPPRYAWWQWRQKKKVKKTLTFHPVEIGGTLYVGTNCGSIYSIDPSLSSRKLFTNISPDNQIVGIHASDTNIIVRTSNELMFFDNKGEQRDKNIALRGPFTIAENLVFCNNAYILYSPDKNPPERRVFNLEAFNFNADHLWSVQLDQSVSLDYGKPLYHGGHIFAEVGTMDHRLAIFDAMDGTLKGFIPLSDSIVFGPFSSGEICYFGTKDKKMHAYRIVSQST